jgi:hypothetical protein
MELPPKRGGASAAPPSPSAWSTDCASIMKSRRRRGATALDKYIGLRLRARRLMLHMIQSDLAKNTLHNRKDIS